MTEVTVINYKSAEKHCASNKKSMTTSYDNIVNK